MTQGRGIQDILQDIVVSHSKYQHPRLDEVVDESALQAGRETERNNMLRRDEQIAESMKLFGSGGEHGMTDIEKIRDAQNGGRR